MECPTYQAFTEVLSATARPRWRLGSRSLSYTIVREWSAVDAATWDACNFQQSVFLSSSYLAALSSSLGPDNEFRFCTFFQEERPVGIAVFHLTHFATSSADDESGEKGMLAWVRRAFRADQRTYSIFMCGNAFATGEHGYDFSLDVPVRKSMDSLCYAMTEVLREERANGRRFSAVLVKDFYAHRTEHAAALSRCGFRSFSVDHNMVLPILPEWKSREDYLAAMNTKFRTKALAALKRSAPLVVRDLSAREISELTRTIEGLYQQVHERASYRMGEMTGEAFAAMKERLGHRMVVRSYWLEGRMVGFLCALQCGTRLDAHLVGIDYTVNAEYAVYQRMLYDFAEIGILSGASLVVFGRTAAEIKSSVGALPMELQCCIRHPGKWHNVLLRWLFAYIEPSEYPHRQPWKKEALARVEAVRQEIAGPCH